MNSGKYTIKAFLTDQNMEQIIIPEIQRDYVWSVFNVDNLLKSLNEDASNLLQYTTDELEQLPPKLRELAEKSLTDNRKPSNIGFIYAYHDPGYSNKYFLIDGQQRITTIFLLLLASSLKDNKQNFRNTYFANNIPKVNYKVREASEEFLRNFVEYILNGHDSNNVKDSNWYFSDYNSDDTIQSIINNYKVISEFLSKVNCQITFDYIEKNVELWYFDTTKSRQGEELYIYMNSRGESVQSNEKIKSTLLEKLSDTEKDKAGKEWEDWQDFFWKNRAKNPLSNADNGFNEFLKWIKIINVIISKKDSLFRDQESLIQSIIKSNEIDSDFLDLNDIKYFFISLYQLYNDKWNSYIKREWLCGSLYQIDYIKILPVLMYVKKNSGASSYEIERFTRFFNNITRLDNISKSPVISLVNSITLTYQFLSDNYTDVVDLANYKSNVNYSGLLSPEEIFKFNIYKNPPVDISREDIEKSFWQAEDYSLNNGRLGFIFYCMGLVKYSGIYDSTLFSFDQFNIIMKYIIEIFGDTVSPSDLMRRALLTKGNYSFWEGNTPKLQGKRYTFIISVDHWRLLLYDNIRMKYLKQLITDYSIYRKEIDDPKVIFQKIIDEYSSLVSEPLNWLSYFILDPKIFAYCKRKNICWLGDTKFGVYLFAGSKATDGNYILLSEFINNLSN